MKGTHRKKKIQISIKLIVMLPLIVLGVISIVSSLVSSNNIKNVNASASNIADQYVSEIIQMGDVKVAAQNIHKLALSHIVAIDFETMLNMTEAIKEQENELEQKLVWLSGVVTGEAKKTYDSLITNYEDFKHAIANLISYSANSETAIAFSYANGDVANYSLAMQDDIDKLTQSVQDSLIQVKAELASAYKRSIATNFATIIIIIVSIILGLYCVGSRINKPISKTVKELRNIIDSIENREGDLTKRVTIHNNDELATLGMGINAFIEKLQQILLTIANNSQKMDHIVNEVLDSVQTSNDMATDLSAITEELSATMVDIADNASLINDNTESVNTEVAEIANKSYEMNEFSIEMKRQAELMQEQAMNNSKITSNKVADIL